MIVENAYSFIGFSVGGGCAWVCQDRPNALWIGPTAPPGVHAWQPFWSVLTHQIPKGRKISGGAARWVSERCRVFFVGFGMGQGNGYRGDFFSTKSDSIDVWFQNLKKIAIVKYTMAISLIILKFEQNSHRSRACFRGKRPMSWMISPRIGPATWQQVGRDWDLSFELLSHSFLASFVLHMSYFSIIFYECMFVGFCRNLMISKI